jgi:PAS domain S-box-containing protein
VVPVLFVLLVVLVIAMAAALREASGIRLLAVAGASMLMIGVLSTGLILERRARARADALWYLEQNRSRMRALADSSPNVVFQLNCDGIVIFLSLAAEKMLGRAVDELVGSDLIERLVAQSAPSTRSRLQRLVAQGRPQVFTVRATGADGVPRLLECSLRLGATDAVTEIWGSLRDVTARRSAGDQLEQLFHLSVDFMAVIDDQGRLAQINPSWTTAFDVDAQDVIGTAFGSWFHAGDRQWVAERPAQLLDEDAVANFENRYDRDGVTRTLLWNAALDPVRGLTYVVGRDVTEQKELTRALAEARDEALEASRVKSEFVTTMSHEIRTPMNGLIGMTDLLLNTPLDASQRRYVEGVRTAGDTLLSVIDDILDFSRIEAGRLVLESLDFRLEDVIDDVATLVRQMASDKGIDLVVDYQPGVPVALNGDPGRLRQVLVHLVDNAVKFTDQGAVLIRVEPGAGGADGRTTVIFKVIDTGIGMDDARLQQLFEPFQQADPGTARPGSGSGLGLSICRRLATLMGGRITAHSEPGHGATFVAELSFAAATDWGRAIRGRDARGLAVLVVNPDKVSRLTMVRQLSRWGMRPVAAGSATEAMTLLARAEVPAGGYDLAVIDLQLSEDDGLALVEQLSAVATFANLPVILLGAPEPSDPDRAPGAGVIVRLPKPVQQSALFDALTRVAIPSTAAVGSAGTGRASTQLTTAEFGSGRPSSRDGSFHLLLVEDNDINQTVALGILSQLGYRVDVAGDGLQALAMTERRNYDAILMDSQMPKMDGYTAAVELRKRTNTRSTPIIAMTVATFAADRQRCFDSGMDDFIAKPVRVASLQAALERWLPVGPPSDPSARSAGTRPGVDSWPDAAVASEPGPAVPVGPEGLAGPGVSVEPGVAVEPGMSAEPGAPVDPGVTSDPSVAVDRAVAVAPGVAVEPARSIGPAAATAVVPVPRTEAAITGPGVIADTGQRITELLGHGTAAEVELVRELIASFLGRTLDLHQRLSLAVTADDAEAACQHAHSLSEAGENLGTVEVVQISRQIEADARAGRPGLSVARLVLLGVALDRARIQLGEVAAALPNPDQVRIRALE